MARKKIQKQRLNERGSEDVAAGVFLILGAICLAVGLIGQTVWIGVLGGILVLCGVPFLLYAVNYRVWWDLDGITVQNLFRRSRLYRYGEFSHYYITIGKSVLVLKNGKKIRLRDSHTDLVEIERTFAQMKRHGIPEDESEKHECPLYWGNCSRPVQLTLFLLLFGFAAFFCGGAAFAGAMPVSEEDLTYSTVTLVTAETDAESRTVYLIDGGGTRYSMDKRTFQSVMDGADWEDEQFVIGSEQDTHNVCYIKYRFGTDPLLTLEEYNDESLKQELFMIVFFGIFFVLYFVFLTLTLLSYRFPEKLIHVYMALETMRFWSRH